MPGRIFFYCFLPGRNEITPRLPKIEKQRRLFEAGDSFRFFLLLLTVGSFVYWIFVRSLFVCIMAGSFVCLSSEGLYVWERKLLISEKKKSFPEDARVIRKTYCEYKGQQSCSKYITMLNGSFLYLAIYLFICIFTCTYII